MVILIIVKDLQLNEINYLLKSGKLESISEYMEIHDLIGAPPLNFPFSVHPIICGQYPVEYLFDIRNTNTVFDTFSNSMSIESSLYNRLESLLIFDPLRIDRKTWNNAENILSNKKPDFLSVTLDSLNIYNSQNKKRVKEKVATFYYFIDHIIHRIYNLISNLRPMIIITGSGSNRKLTERIYYDSLDTGKTFSPVYGLTLIKDNKLSKNIEKDLFNQGVELISYKKENGYKIVFKEGILNVSYQKQHLLVENEGKTPLNDIPRRLTRREIFHFTKDSEHPELLRHIEDIYNNYEGYETIVSNENFHSRNLKLPVLINKQNAQLNKTSDLYTLIHNRIINKLL